MDGGKEYYVIDRIESQRIIVQSLESGEVFNVERDIFIDEPNEGDAIYLEEGKFRSDFDYTIERKKSLAIHLSRLLSRGKK